MNREWKAYLRTLEAELGEELAQRFTQSLFEKSRGSVKAATQFFYDLGLRWAPLMYHWAEWVKENAEGEIAIILRDAKPLTALPVTKGWKQLYLNRLVCGVPDELSGHDEVGKHPLLMEYLRQNKCSKYFTFVDSGCYGTVVKELHGIGLRFKPLFFFSKNPSIPGFLNEIGVPMKDGELLNDSLECGFPHLYYRPARLVRGLGKVRVALQRSDALSIRFGTAAMRGVSNAPSVPTMTRSESVEALLRLSEEARSGNFTGILEHTSPEWTEKQKFLESWPSTLCWT